MEILLWLGASLAVASLLGLFWKGRGRPGRPAGWVLPSIGTLLVAGGGFGVVCFAWWAETAGVRPGWLRFAASLWVASLSGGLVLGLWSRRVRPISGRWLVTGMAFGVLVLLAGFYGVDAGLRRVYESRLIEAEGALERLRPPPVPPEEDARPLYDRVAEKLAGESAILQVILDEPLAAVREHPGRVRRVLEEHSEALRLARKARTLKRVAMEAPHSIFSAEFRGEDEDGEIAGHYGLIRSMVRLSRLIAVEALLAASARDVAAVEDHLEWLAQIAQQLRPAPDFLVYMVVQSIEGKRLKLVEDILALLGPSSPPPHLRLPRVPESVLRERARRQIHREHHWAVYNALLLWLGEAELEEVQKMGPAPRWITREWMRLYRVFVLPADLRAIDAYAGALVEALESLEVNRMVMPGHELGWGPMSGLLLTPGTHILVRELQIQRTEEEVVRTALAVAAWRAAEGSYPESLEALTPDRLAATPRDVVTAQPIGYERLEHAEGAVVFSPWDPYDRRNQREDSETDWQDLLPRRETLLVLLGPARDAYREEEPLELPPEEL